MMATEDRENPRRGTHPPGEPFLLAQLAEYAPGSVVSRALVRMPGNVPHAVDAQEPFKMLLLMIRES